jgi:hypothetical protein
MAETAENPDNSIILSCAYSDDKQLQIMALNSLLIQFRKDGTLSKELLEIPRILALSPPGNLEVKLKAINILGSIGGNESLSTLSNILSSNNDSLILTEVVNASSKINSEDYRCFVNALASAMKRQHSLFKDNGFAIASLMAIDSITENAGNILSSEILGMMMLYSGNGYEKEVREYSRKLMQTILSER